MQIGTCIASSLMGCLLVAQLTIVMFETQQLVISITFIFHVPHSHNLFSSYSSIFFDLFYEYGLNFLAHFIPLLVYTFSLSKLLFPYAIASVISYLVGDILLFPSLTYRCFLFSASSSPSSSLTTITCSSSNIFRSCRRECVLYINCMYSCNVKFCK